MNKKLIIAIVIIILILLTAYILLGSSTPENITQVTNINKSNVSGIYI